MYCGLQIEAILAAQCYAAVIVLLRIGCAGAGNNGSAHLGAPAKSKRYCRVAG
jgi:hypothetical protein